MIRYLLDSSALWRLLREQELRRAWTDVITAGAVGSCSVQRAQFRRSARSVEDFEAMGDMFADLYPDVPTPKSLWRWIDRAQYLLVKAGSLQGVSVIDLAVAGTAAAGGLVILHDDRDMALIANHVADVRHRDVRDIPDDT